jgi:hypothetical protein
MPSICYLCGQPLNGKLSRDHIPPKQFLAEELRRKHNPQMFRLQVHEACNLDYQNDEDYFVYSLMPFGRGSYSGDALRRKILDDCVQHTEQRTLLNKVLNEFERRPSGLILPPDLVVKRFEGERILRVAWKIVRGLYFSHFSTFVPEDVPKGCEVIPPGQKPPDSFLIMLDGADHGKYPGVFDYRFKAFPESHNLNYWAMLLWDRIILTLKFQFPSCNCCDCIAQFQADHD